MGGATFTPVARNWRFYKDDGAEPTADYAAENTTFTLPRNDRKARLRITIADTGGKAGNGLAVTLQYSYDDSTFYNFGPSADWNYADGQATDGNVLTGLKLTDSSAAGEYIETASNAVSFAASTATELDICIAGVSGIVNPSDVYYFRVVIDGATVPLDSGETHPYLSTTTATQTLNSSTAWEIEGLDSTFLDDVFTGTDATEASTHTPASGIGTTYGSWSKHPDFSGSATIYSNRLQAAAGNDCLYYGSGSAQGNDYEVHGLIRRTVAGTDELVGVCGRLDTTANANGYCFQWNNGNWQLYKAVAGSWSQLGSNVPHNLVVGALYHVYLSMVGTTIAGYVNGAQVISVTDGSVSSGKAGMRLKTGSSGTGQSLWLENVCASGIPTVVTKIVDTDGTQSPDYTSLNAAEGQNLDLIATHQRMVIKCRSTAGAADTTAVAFSGWVNDLAHGILIEADTGHRHAGVWDNSKYRLEGGDATGMLQIHSDYVSIRGLQIRATSTGPCIYMTSTEKTFGIFDGLICRMSHADAEGLKATLGGFPCLLTNSIFYKDVTPGTGDDAIVILSTITNSRPMLVANCTIYGMGQSGIRANAGAVKVVNSAVFGNVDDFTPNGGTITVEYCASDDGDGSSPVTPSNWNNVFTDITNRNFHLKSTDTDLQDAGTDLSMVVILDVDGETRGTPYDIGADALLGFSLAKSTGWQILKASNATTAWKILADLDAATAWEILAALSLGSDTAWKRFGDADAGTAWGIKNDADAGTAWAIKNDADAGTAWAIKNDADAGTAWGIKTDQNTAAAWKIFAAAVENTAWLVKAGLDHDAAWKIIGALGHQTAWKIIEAIAHDAAWRVKNGVEEDAAWKILTLFDQDTAWAIFDSLVLDRSTAWRINTDLDAESAWKIATDHDQAAAWRIIEAIAQDAAWSLKADLAADAAWRIINSIGTDAAWNILASFDTDSAWKLFAGANTDVAWRLISDFAQTTAWQILIAGSLEADTAWKIVATEAQAAAWKILAGQSQDAAWKIITGLPIDTSWWIKEGIEQDAAWKILAGLGVDTGWKVIVGHAKDAAWRIMADFSEETAWQIFNTLAIDQAAAWKILTRDDTVSAWRVLAGVTENTAWRIFNLTDTESAWLIKAIASSTDTGWKIINNVDADTAWDLLSEIVIPPEALFLATSRNTIFTAPSRTFFYVPGKRVLIYNASHHN